MSEETLLTGGGDEGGVIPPATPDVSFLNGDGSFAETWKDNLPEDIRGSDVLDKYQNFSEMAKGLVQANSMVGRKMEKLPSADSTPEEWADFHSKMGRPEKADGYELKHLEGLNADELKAPREAFSQKAHELGLSQDVAQKLMSWQEQNMIDGANNSQEASFEQNVESLKGQWGNDYDTNLANASKVADSLGMTKDIEAAGLGANPTVLNLLSQIASKTSEGSFMQGKGTQFAGSLSDQLKEVQMELKEAYANQTPNLSELIKKQGELIEKQSQE